MPDFPAPAPWTTWNVAACGSFSVTICFTVDLPDPTVPRISTECPASYASRHSLAAYSHSTSRVISICFRLLLLFPLGFPGIRVLRRTSPLTSQRYLDAVPGGQFAARAGEVDEDVVAVFDGVDQPGALSWVRLPLSSRLPPTFSPTGETPPQLAASAA